MKLHEHWKTQKYGATVRVAQRMRNGKPYGSLVLAFTSEGELRTRALKHHDLKEAKEQAKELSLQLTNARAIDSGAPGAKRKVTVAQLFSRYATEVTAHKQGQQPKEDARRRALWTKYLGPNTLARDVNSEHVVSFIRDRAAGAIEVEGFDFKKHPKPATIDADIVWLLSVYNWADRTKLVTGKPLANAQRPEVPEQLRPMAPEERVAKILKVADRVSYPRFRLLFIAVRWLGWRISATCKIDGTDINRAKSKLAPHGMIRKRGENDKKKRDQWLPMPKALRVEIDRAQVAATGPVFPSVKDAAKPINRWFARDRLCEAETLAKLTAIEGGDWHPYRRLWATERKGLPLTDVMGAGGWSDQRTMQKYMQQDPATTSAVMLFTPKKGSRTGAKTGAQPRTNSRRK